MTLSARETHDVLEVAANLIRSAARHIDTHFTAFPPEVQQRLEALRGLAEVHPTLAAEIDAVAETALEAA